MISTYYVYIVECADSSLYTGITTNLEKRLRQHNGEITGGAKYTKTRRPVKLVYSEPSENRSTASKREYQIKQYKRSEKIKLIQEAPFRSLF